MRAPRASGSLRRRPGSQPAPSRSSNGALRRSRCSRDRCENSVINLELATAAGSSRFFSLALRAGAAMTQDDFVVRAVSLRMASTRASMASADKNAASKSSSLRARTLAPGRARWCRCRPRSHRRARRCPWSAGRTPTREIVVGVDVLERNRRVRADRPVAHTLTELLGAQTLLMHGEDQRAQLPEELRGNATRRTPPGR